MKPRRENMLLRLALLVAVTLAASISKLGSAEPVLRRVTFREDFTSGSLDAWQFPFPEDWGILSEGPLHYLHMKRNREPGVPRRPLQFALLKGLMVGSFELETRVRREGRSMIVVFDYVDTLHFYYAHLSQDPGAQQPVHNGIFIVNGEPRKRISATEVRPALPDPKWHQVRLVRNAFTGSINVYMDGQPDPLFSVHDDMFVCGQIGLGSFDETGDFTDVKLTSEDVGCNLKELTLPASLNGGAIGLVK